jgi:hypothetical protein
MTGDELTLTIERGFDADRDDPVAVMVVEIVSERLLADLEGDMRLAGEVDLRERLAKLKEPGQAGGVAEGGDLIFHGWGILDLGNRLVAST